MPSCPTGGWKGEKGHIDASVLSRGLTGGEHRCLPERCRRLVYFICGLDSMIYALAHLGVP